jgi:transglutaminase-like putative cysteine protease
MTAETRTYRVKHVTSYAYAEPVLLAHHQAHLIPREFANQNCQRSLLRVTPIPAEMDERGRDYFGNPVAFFALRDAHSTLSVQAISKVEVRDRCVPDAESTMRWTEDLDMLSSLSGEQVVDVADFLFDSPFVGAADAISDYAGQSFAPGRPILACLIELNQRIHDDFIYDSAATTVATPLSEVLEQKRGVCQDFAHLAIACVRSVGLPARYVSGHLMTQPPPGKQKLRGADASHAWLSVYVPQVGWVDFDPTNACLPNLDHVTLSWGRDYGDVSPLSGVVLGGGDHSLKVAVDVEPVSA